MPAEERSHARAGVPMRPFSESLPMALLRTRESLMRLFRPGLRASGVSEQQWRILRALADRGALEVTELARATLLLAPSLSRILPDMEERGLLERKAQPHDLRRSVIRLTPAGLRLIAAHAPYSEAAYAAIAREFGTDRVHELFALLAELEACVSRAGAARGRSRTARPQGAPTAAARARRNR